MSQSLYYYLYHQKPTGGITLFTAGMVVGLLLLLSHIYALLKGEQVKSFLQKFPRNYPLGIVILTLALLWALMCLKHMDMGEFYHLRDKLLMGVPIFFLLVVIYVREFLSVRALGCLMLLVAGPVLEAAFLQPPVSRLLLPALAYVWIIAGMFFIGMPFLLRDAIQWLLAKESRWKLATLSGIAYGVIVLGAAVLFWR
jgi:hypothetical protein